MYHSILIVNDHSSEAIHRSKIPFVNSARFNLFSMNTNQSVKAGYTRTGKSLKAVRRYYALLNQNKQKSPDDEKLSKRIAVELKTQQDANEKRSKREGNLVDQTTERSELTDGVVVSPKNNGPVFVLPTATPLLEGTNSIYSPVKSLKSAKSAPTEDVHQATGVCQKIIYFLIGLVLGLLVGVLIYYGLSYIKRDPEEEDTVESSGVATVHIGERQPLITGN